MDYHFEETPLISFIMHTFINDVSYIRPIVRCIRKPVSLI